jgi:hypothetical protein
MSIALFKNHQFYFSTGWTVHEIRARSQGSCHSQQCPCFAELQPASGHARSRRTQKGSRATTRGSNKVPSLAHVPLPVDSAVLFSPACSSSQSDFPTTKGITRFRSARLHEKQTSTGLTGTLRVVLYISVKVNAERPRLPNQHRACCSPCRVVGSEHVDGILKHNLTLR